MGKKKTSELKPEEKQLTIKQGAELERRRALKVFDGMVRVRGKKLFWGQFKG